MKTLSAVLLSAAFVSAAVSAPAFANGGGHRHHRARVGVFIGAPLVFAPWYYHHPHRYYYPSTVIVPSAPPVYIEQSQAAPPVQPSQAYWYYCPESNIYYPYVNQCAVPWQRVVPQPPPS